MKRKKVCRMRGTKTCGYGPRKHRGAGNRGGRGNAGRKKQGKIRGWKRGEYLGKRGFKSLVQRRIAPSVKTINLRELARLAVKEKEIDVTKLGYDKVLGAGEWRSSARIKANSFSARAKEKIEKAGGKAVTE